MSYITVPHTCPYIDDVIQKIESVLEITEEHPGEYGGPMYQVHVLLVNTTNIMEDIRCMNAELRDEGETAGEAADNFENQADDLQDMLHSAEMRAEALEEKLFDIEKEREETEWREFLRTQRNLLTASS